MKVKTTLLLLLGNCLTLLATACPVCERRQPAWLQGVSHGTGPQSDWDYVIVWGMVIVVAVTLFFSIKLLIKPGEHTGSHIKRTILTLEDGIEK